jgi:hypothetical protein
MEVFTAHPMSDWGRQQTVEGDGLLRRWLLHVVDGGLIGIIGIAPYFFGGRHDVGRLLLVSLIAITSAAWFLRQAMLPQANWPRTSIFAISLIACGLLVFQVIPTSAGVD